MLFEQIGIWIMFLVTGFGSCALSILTHKALIEKNTLKAVLAFLVSITFLVLCVGTGNIIIQGLGEDQPICPECEIRVETPYCGYCDRAVEDTNDIPG